MFLILVQYGPNLNLTVDENYMETHILVIKFSRLGIYGRDKFIILGKRFVHFANKITESCSFVKL